MLPFMEHPGKDGGFQELRWKEEYTPKGPERIWGVRNDIYLDCVGGGDVVRVGNFKVYYCAPLRTYYM